jgi:hypothetical protein
MPYLAYRCLGQGACWALQEKLSVPPGPAETPKEKKYSWEAILDPFSTSLPDRISNLAQILILHPHSLVLRFVVIASCDTANSFNLRY